MRDKLIRALPHWLLKEQIEEIPPRIWFRTLEVAYDSLFRAQKLEWKKRGVFFTVAEVRPGDPKPPMATTSTARLSTTKKNEPTRMSKTPKQQVKVPLEPTITVHTTDDDDESDETTTFVPIEQTSTKNLRSSKRKTTKVPKSSTTDNLEATCANIIDKNKQTTEENQLQMALIQSKFQYDKEQGNRHRRRRSDQNVDFIEERPL